MCAVVVRRRWNVRSGSGKQPRPGSERMRICGKVDYERQ